MNVTLIGSKEDYVCRKIAEHYNIGIINNVNDFGRHCFDVDVLIIDGNNTTQWRMDEILTLARYRAVKKIIYLSTGKVYGNKTDFPSEPEFKPDLLSTTIINTYVGELYCGLFNKNNGLKCVVLRLFDVYGDDEKISIVQELLNGDAMLEVSPTAIRDFVHIDDVLNIVKYYVEKGSFNFDVVNVATGVETKISDLVKKTNSNVTYAGGKIEKMCGAIEELKFIGIEPKINLNKWLEGKTKC